MRDEDLQLEFQPSRNLPWRSTAMSRANRAAFARAGALGHHSLARMFWSIYGLRRRPFRLRVAGDVIAANRHAADYPARPVGEVFAVLVWRELPRQPGSFLPRLDTAMAEALSETITESEAVRIVSELRPPCGIDGRSLSLQLLAVCTRRRVARTVAFEPAYLPIGAEDSLP